MINPRKRHSVSNVLERLATQIYVHDTENPSRYFQSFTACVLDQRTQHFGFVSHGVSGYVNKPKKLTQLTGGSFLLVENHFYKLKI